MEDVGPRGIWPFHGHFKGHLMFFIHRFYF
jgi:hypothetical protein